ncbi:uncharacterized protein LOC123321774 [Coccinella septempunctata]|uniref:uncharacterized protein LOC123321774 n=1 Tax=Coccinella septempunctata TaxID=41139 RepID=UPI001D0905A6|nr:uncharacterized protein LOC123321774 [Coccinella septempunctata]
MKNLSVFVNFTQGGSYNFHQSPPLEHGNRQGRTYGPLLNFLLATFLTKVVAKYAASSLLPISHQPWFSNKPVNYLSFNQIHQPNQIWKPASPYLHGLTAFAAESYPDRYSPPDPLQTDDHHLIGNGGIHETPTTIDGHSHPTEYHMVDTTIETPETVDQFPSQSQYSFRRQPPPHRWPYPSRRNYPPPRRNYPNRYPNDQRNRNPSHRFGTTASYYDYYDNYDDLATWRTPHRTKRPLIRRRPTTESYDYYPHDNSEYDDSSYDDYFDKTTKFYEATTNIYKRRRKPTKKTKIRKRTDEIEEDIGSNESAEELDEKSAEEKPTTKEKEFKPKQRQQASTTTTESTTTESTESTTTESSTTMTTTKSSTSNPVQNVTQPNGYGQGGNYDHIRFTYEPPNIVQQNYGPPYAHHTGYGPSSINERISITQKPSTFPLFYHNFPYANLFPQEFTKNAIVQKVQDIVGFGHDYLHRE